MTWRILDAIDAIIGEEVDREDGVTVRSDCCCVETR